MKWILSAVYALFAFVFSWMASCPLTNTPLNEEDSVKNICSVSILDYDYSFDNKDREYGYRIGDEREIHVGNKINGMEFDGEKGYHYIDGSRFPMREFSFEEYDARTDEMLLIAQQIISEGYYIAYNEESLSFRYILFHFQITEEGLALFQDRNFTSGMIDCEYNDGVFEYFRVDLFEKDHTRPDVSYDIGTIPYTISYG